MKIYTKTGDSGHTGLLGGDRIAKNSLRIAAIGDVDELNASLGLVAAAGEDIHRIQCWLFDLGAELAAPPGGKFDRPSLGARQIGWLEAEIDRQTDALPPLQAFVLPGGSPAAAALHWSRVVCRRAERSIFDLHASEPIREEARVFINRLSDYLFCAARCANAAAGVADIEWHRQEEPC